MNSNNCTLGDVTLIGYAELVPISRVNLTLFLFTSDGSFIDRFLFGIYLKLRKGQVISESLGEGL